VIGLHNYKINQSIKLVFNMA